MKPKGYLKFNMDFSFWIYCVCILISCIECVYGGCPEKCVCEGKTVNCAFRGFNNVPQDMPKQTHKIDLQGNNITIIRRRDFEGYRQLRNLLLLENQIHTIERGSFEDLTEMERLRLDRNRLVAVPGHLFSTMPNLQRLDLSYNRLRFIGKDTLTGSMVLKNLQLDHNELTCVSGQAIKTHRFMEILTLNNNNLTTMPNDIFENMRKLRTLRLMNNNFNCDCNLRWLARWLRNVRRLGRGTECSTPSNLQSIELKDLDEMEFKCNDLQHQVVNQCLEEAMCPSRCRCTEGVVDCRDLRLTAVPKNFPEDVVEIRLEGNSIARIPSRAFADLSRLRRIDISNNKISHIAPDAFAGLSSLNSLVLYANKITELPLGVFRDLSSLQLLLLNANKIKCLHADIFRDLFSLNLLSLYDNKIMSMANGTFDSLRNIQTLHLGRNPFICDCNLAWLAEYLQRRPVETSSVRCESPRRMERKKIARTRPSKFRCKDSEVHRTKNAGTCMVDVECPEGCVCMGTLVDCSGRELTIMPSNIPSYTTKLLLKGNRITRLEANGLFVHLTNIQHLDLSNNLIEEIVPNAFEGASKLVDLNLSNNRINRVTSKSLAGLSALQTLSLDRNRITCLSNTTLSSSLHLRKLSLYNNQIRCITAGSLDNLRYLVTLNLEANPFTCNCHLSWFSDWLKRVNIITGSPTCFSPHNLKDSPIHDIRTADFVCEANNELGCNIGVSPCCSDEEVAPVDSSCDPRAYCPPLCTCTGTVVRCSRQMLTEIPSHIPLDTTELYLDVNNITHLNMDISQLSQLQRLDLSNNKLVTLPESIFSNLTQLSTLILSFNKLECMAASSFSGLRRLRILSLHGNQLSTIPYSSFNDLDSLTHLALGENPLYCDCNLKWLVDYIKNDYMEPGIAGCAGPVSMVNKLILTTPPAAFQCSQTADPDSVAVAAKCNACHQNPCLHNGICRIRDFKNFTCDCTPGYHGQRCENEINACFGNPCMNDGHCEVLNHGRFNSSTFSCRCRAGFEGERCSININDCKTNSCLNGATCIDMVEGFSCQCAMGYKGKSCEHEIQYCTGEENYCQNGAMCVPLDSDYRCECTAGYTGKNCTDDIDDCLSHICQNGAQCVDLLGKYTCTCLRGYTGKYCEIPPINIYYSNDYSAPGACRNHECQNNGVCYKPKGSQDYMCQCAPGFSGKMCEKMTSVSFLDTDSYIQWPKLDFESWVNITIVMKTQSDSGLIFYTGQEQHLAVELFRGRVGISFYVGNTPTSTMFSYIFSYVEVNDDRIHYIELMLNRRNFTMRVDGGVSRSVVNQGNRDFLDINDDVYFGGLPTDVSARARSKFHIRSESSFRGCYQSVYVNNKLMDFMSSKLNRKIMPGCKVDPCLNHQCQKGRCKPRKKRQGYRCKCTNGYSGRFCDVGPTCRPKVFRSYYTHPKTNCKSRTRIKFRRCQGSCGNGCCKPKKIKSRKIRLYCQNGTSYMYKIQIIRRCGCQRCSFSN
ncbi:protein slit-like isoform X1 [Pecten maximus]|uniref:protein slit-like isoform X1 n=1 Tax=Pecten maximus TaxID=6579 RepID=UPI001458D973|nr:protein slit-like isoform X1 [Pecten maximus]